MDAINSQEQENVPFNEILSKYYLAAHVLTCTAFLHLCSWTRIICLCDPEMFLNVSIRLIRITCV